MSTTAALTAKELEQIDRAQYQKALESLKMYFPGLKKKAAERKKSNAANTDNKNLQDAIKQAYLQKMERRNRLLETSTATKTRSTEKPATTNNNTGVNWKLINKLPHNLDADEATGTDPEADIPFWHIIESLEHNIGID